MRATDHRYTGEISKFNLAIRMIGHEARTGTIRNCTGFSEDRIRKIWTTYFKNTDATPVRRRRGKSPRQITPFVNSSMRQTEATVLACLFVNCGLLRVSEPKLEVTPSRLDPLTLGEQMCNAYETYCSVHPRPQLCFERAWSLYYALTREQELILARCDDCSGPYIQDRYALDYAWCPFCDIKHTQHAS